MNKYIYKVRFVTLYNKNICINRINFWQTTEKLIANKYFEKYECFMSILKKIHFLISDH